MDVYAEVAALVNISSDEEYRAARARIIDYIGERAYLVVSEMARQDRVNSALAAYNASRGTTHFL